MADPFIPSTDLDMLSHRGLSYEISNAGEKVLINLSPHYLPAMEMLRTDFRLGDRAEEAMNQFFACHGAMMAKVDQLEPIIVATQFHQFYSLIYHLLDQGEDGKLAQARRDIESTFELLGMQPPLPKEEVIGLMRSIQEFAKAAKRELE